MALIPFVGPTTIGVFGCTQSGKSTFIQKLLTQSTDMFNTPPKWILYCYGVHDDRYDEMQKAIPILTLCMGLPDRETIEQLTENRHHGVVVLDDLMASAMEDKNAQNMFIMGSHHRNMTIIYVGQNIFYQGRCARTISLNLHYMVLFRNLRDKSQIRTFAQQAFPGQVSDFMSVYKDIHSRPFSYLVVDLHPHTNDDYRLRTNVFVGEEPIIYQLDEK